jgi:hypothetical protein
MIMARNGRIQAKTGHDHEAAFSLATETTTFTLSMNSFMIAKD